MKIRRQRGGADDEGHPTNITEWFSKAIEMYNTITDEDAMKQFKLNQFTRPSLSLDSIPEPATSNSQLDQSVSTIATSAGIRANIRNVAISLFQVFTNIYEHIKTVGEINTLGVFVQQASAITQTNGSQTNDFDTLKKFEILLRSSAKELGFDVKDSYIEYPFFTFTLLMNAPNGTPKPLMGPVDDAVDALLVAPIPAAPAARAI